MEGKINQLKKTFHARDEVRSECGEGVERWRGNEEGEG